MRHMSLSARATSSTDIRQSSEPQSQSDAPTKGAVMREAGYNSGALQITAKDDTITSTIAAHGPRWEKEELTWRIIRDAEPFRGQTLK